MLSLSGLNRLSRRALLGLAVLAVLLVIAWKLLSVHLAGALPQPLAKLAPARVRTECLHSLARNLGTPVARAQGSAPVWTGDQWRWTATAQVDSGPLRFACTLVGGGSQGVRAILRVLN